MSQNGHKPCLPGPGVHPGDASDGDNLKLIAAISGVHVKFLAAAAAGCGPDCECPCPACSIDQPYVVHECWHRLAA